MSDSFRAPRLAEILALAWPIVISRSTQVVIGLTDAAMTAPLGEHALAAATAGALNTVSFLILPMGVVFIVSSFTSQLAGKGDPEGARRYGIYGLVVAAAAELLCLVAIAVVPSMLSLTSYDANVRALMGEFIAYRLLSGGAAVGMEALAGYYGGLGNTKLPMRANVFAMVLNVALAYVLVFGRFGIPPLGVAGAAIANSIATVVAFAGLLTVFLAEGRRTKHTGFAWSELWNMLAFGLPSGLNWFLEFAAYVFFVNVVVVDLGTTSVAAMMTVMQINSTSFMPAFGIASAGAIFCGQAIGASAKDLVGRIVLRTFAICAVWQGLVGLAYVAMPGVLLGFFAIEGASGRAFLEVGRRMLVLSAAWQLADAAANTVGEALRAAGDTTFCLWARVAIAWLVFVPGALVAVRVLDYGDVGAISALVLYLVLLAITLTVRFRSGAWKRLVLVETSA